MGMGLTLKGGWEGSGGQGAASLSAHGVGGKSQATAGRASWATHENLTEALPAAVLADPAVAVQCVLQSRAQAAVSRCTPYKPRGWAESQELGRRPGRARPPDKPSLTCRWGFCGEGGAHSLAGAGCGVCCLLLAFPGQLPAAF